MRKILLTTSALAGVALVTGTAMAEAPTVTFSGSTDYYVRVTDYDAAAGQAPQNGPGWDINQHAPASELIWDANATADNGLQFGAQVQLRYAGTATTDEAWIDFAGSWGRVVLGDDDGVIDNNQIAGHSVLPIGAYDTGRFTGAIASPAGWSSPVTPTGGPQEASGDSSKIAYYSPSFAGFSFGVSATPDTGSSFGANNAATVGGYQNAIEATVNYKGDFGGVGVGLHGGYATGDAFSSNGVSREDLDAFELGGSVSVAGFAVAVGYTDAGESGLVSNSGGDAGKAFTAGVAYNFGAGKVGVGYATTWDAKSTATSAESEAEYYSVEGSYTIAQGLTGYGGVMWANREVSTAGVADADSTIFVLGTRVNF